MGAFEDYLLTNTFNVLVQCLPQEMGCLSTAILQTLTSFYPRVQSTLVAIERGVVTTNTPCLEHLHSLNCM